MPMLLFDGTSGPRSMIEKIFEEGLRPHGGREWAHTMTQVDAHVFACTTPVGSRDGDPIRFAQRGAWKKHAARHVRSCGARNHASLVAMITRAAWLADEIAGLPCRVLLPDPYAPHAHRYPLLVSLHGSGERGTDNWAQLDNGLSELERRRAQHPCIVVAPQLPLGETWGGSWYGGETAGQRMLVAAVRALRERRSIDPRRVYGVGFSMGAIGLWDILVRHAGLFTAAVLVAGDLDLAISSSLTSFPLWSVVGGRDALVPPDNTRAFARLTEERGGLAKVTEIASAGHDVWRIAFAHAPLWDWLFTHEATRARVDAPEREP